MAADHADRGFLIWDHLGIFQEMSGIGQYARKLLPGLKAHGWEPRLFDGTLCTDVLSQGGADGGGLGAGKVSHLASRYPQSKFPSPQLRPLKACKGSIVHGLSNINTLMLPLRSDIRTVITIHDLIPLQTSSGRYGVLFKGIFRSVCVSAHAIITVSEWTKVQLIERGIPGEKITVIPNGFPSWNKSNRNPSGELLCVSREEGYKNLSFFAKLLHHTGLKGTLVTDGKGMEKMAREFPAIISKGQLVLKHHLSPEGLDRLYSSVSLYVHPSSLEGFCLPAAEANARGVPVLYRKGSGIDETVKYGLGLDNFDLAEWSRAVQGLIDARPPDNLEKSVKANSWESSAEKLAEIYNNLKEEL